MDHDSSDQNHNQSPTPEIEPAIRDSRSGNMFPRDRGKLAMSVDFVSRDEYVVCCADRLFIELSCVAHSVLEPR